MDMETLTTSILRRAGICLDPSLPECPVRHAPILALYPDVRVNRIAMDPDTCGVYVVSRSRHYITINTSNALVRQRFSLAHEFGHYILAHGSGWTFQGKQDVRREHEANLFARRILMPESLVKRLHERLSTIGEMAVWFRVHEVTMAIRLQELDLRPVESLKVIEEYRRKRSEWARARQDGCSAFAQ